MVAILVTVLFRVVCVVLGAPVPLEGVVKPKVVVFHDPAASAKVPAPTEAAAVATAVELTR